MKTAHRTPHTSRRVQSQTLRERPVAHPVRQAPEKFNAKRVAKTTGFRVADEARAAGRDARRASSEISKLGAGDALGDIGNLALAVIGGILGLILIDLLISSRGSNITSAALKWSGTWIGRLVAPTDPLVFAGTPPATNLTPGPAAGSSTSSSAAPPKSGKASSGAAAGASTGTPPTSKTGTPGAGG